jgi:hypothetical protein
VAGGPEIDGGMGMNAPRMDESDHNGLPKKEKPRKMGFKSRTRDTETRMTTMMTAETHLGLSYSEVP